MSDEVSVHYLPEGVEAGVPADYVPPDAGTGTVFVGPPDGDGIWGASWQGPGSRFASIWGPERAVLAWARAQPAEKWLICREHRDELIWIALAR